MKNKKFDDRVSQAADGKNCKPEIYAIHKGKGTKGVSRRAFIGKGIAGTAALGVGVAGIVACSTKEKDEVDKSREEKAIVENKDCNNLKAHSGNCLQ